MFDNDINNSIRKGIKIGKWFIGTTIIINIAIWTVIGFFTYKYIYIDYIASKYSGPEHEEEVIVEKFKAVHSFEKGLKNNLDFEKIYKAKDSVLTADQLSVIEKEKIITVGYPTFVGFKLKNLYDFFMLFVILCGLAGLLLYALTPMMKKMMHGVR